MNTDQNDVQSGPQATEKLPALVAIACFWPVILVSFGGLVGGLLGGAAGAVNLGLYRSNLPRWSLWLLNPAVGLSAILIWFVIAVAIEVALSGSN